MPNQTATRKTPLQVDRRLGELRWINCLVAAVVILATSVEATGQKPVERNSVGQQWSETKHYAVVQGGARVGSQMCTDRDYVFRQIPSSLRGSDYLKMRMDDKQSDPSRPLLQLTLSRSATITVGYDHRCEQIPRWLSSWRKTGEIITGAERWQGVLYSKDFPAGQVLLNGNKAPGADGMYAVFASQGSLSAVRTNIVRPQTASTASTSAASYNRVRDRHDFIVFMEEGGWCWYQDPRAIIHDDKLLIGSVQGNGSGPALVGIYDLEEMKRLGRVVMHDNFRRDDHNSPVFHVRPDGSVLAVYALHNSNRIHYYRISDSGDLLSWSQEMTFTHDYPAAGNVTYMNLYEMKNEGKLYNFFRGIEFNPSFITSTDNGKTWGQPTHFVASELQGTHRPYARYAGNGTDTVHVSFTDGHPRKFGNSIYYAAFRGGHYFKANGESLKALSAGPLRPSESELVYRGSGKPGRRADQSALGAAWTSSMVIDTKGNPHIAYTVYLSNKDHRYRIASWNGRQWIDREVAFAGNCLYDRESSYTGLITLDPVDPSVVLISTDVDPSRGTSQGGHHEIYRARVNLSDDIDSIEWQSVTRNSPVRNIRPLIVRDGDRRVVLWNRGEFISYNNYQLDTVGFVENVGK